MLNHKDVAATIAVSDLERARQFYGDTLGFEELDSDPDMYVSYKSGKMNFLVYKSQFAGGYKATVATWKANGAVDQIVANLKQNGVAFEQYNMPDTKHDGDVHVSGAMRMAWFKDPDENILCVVGKG